MHVELLLMMSLSVTSGRINTWKKHTHTDNKIIVIELFMQRTNV